MSDPTQRDDAASDPAKKGAKPDLPRTAPIELFIRTPAGHLVPLADALASEKAAQKKA